MNLIEAINKITSQKKESNIYPHHATFKEVSNEMGIDILEVKEKVIKLGLTFKRTINDFYIEEII